MRLSARPQGLELFDEYGNVFTVTITQASRILVGISALYFTSAKKKKKTTKGIFLENSVHKFKCHIIMNQMKCYFYAMQEKHLSCIYFSYILPQCPLQALKTDHREKCQETPTL